MLRWVPMLRWLMWDARDDDRAGYTWRTSRTSWTKRPPVDEAWLRRALADETWLRRALVDERWLRRGAGSLKYAPVALSR